jgi:membrane protease YdiL (CAAX protease family)
LSGQRANFRDLSHRAEFVLVIALAFGFSILGSVLSVFSASAEVGLSEAGLWSLVVYELAMLVVLGLFLAARGWDAKQLGLAPNRTDPWVGIGLGLVAYAAFLCVWMTLGQAVPGAAEIREGTIQHDLRVGTVLLASIVNGIFEEIFVCGYVVSALRKTRSISFAINVSVAIRLSYHLYQGPAGVVSIVPIGLVFTYWFARTGRLWPLAIAHCLWDIFGLWPYLAGD